MRASERRGPPDVIVRTTAFLVTVGGAAAVLLAADLVLAEQRGGLLLVAPVAATVSGPLLLALAPRIPRPGLVTTILVAGALLAASTALAPSSTVALGVASLTLLLAVESTLFLRPVTAWSLVALVSAAQVAALTVGHGVPLLVCAAAVVLWAGVALAADVLGRRASTAHVDPLTGLPDRRGWDEELEHAIDRRERRGTPLSLALVDIDHFKRVNDAQGHAAGDELLRRTADVWRAVDVPGMVVGRRGGDEFAVLLPGLTGPEARDVAEHLCAIAPRAASCGVAEHAAGETATEVLRRTDSALYAAKAAGRGRTVLSQIHRPQLVAELADAIAAGELRVELQPVVDLPSRRVTGVEALARWDHPRLGSVPPDEFVAAAEDGGLIDALGTSVLTRACADALELERRWGREVRLGVNVSGRELAGAGYAEHVLRTLTVTGWPPARFVVEVTESVVDATGPAALSSLAVLRDSGVQIGVDDFGTGWSSLSRLDELPVDFLKLDRAFLTSITSSRRRTTTVRGLLRLCAELDVVVIAEGVETEEQATLLEDLGCTAGQGFLFGPPQPVDELASAPWDHSAQRGAR